ncbi:MAG: hypothetical protein ACTSRG_22690 [Candidatus Helarchaeota archaeon]
MSKKNINKPVKKFSFGNVTGSIFINSDKESGNSWFSCTIQKFYNAGTKKKAEWEYTSSFNQMDLPYLELVQKEVFKFMVVNNANKYEEDEEDEE